MRSSTLINLNKSTNDFLKNIDAFVHENWSNNFIEYLIITMMLI